MLVYQRLQVNSHPVPQTDNTRRNQKSINDIHVSVTIADHSMLVEGAARLHEHRERPRVSNPTAHLTTCSRVRTCYAAVSRHLTPGKV